MASTNLGRVAIVPKGAYNAATAYKRLDLVTYDNSSYLAKGPTTGNLPTNTTYWQAVANVSEAVSACESATEAANEAASDANELVNRVNNMEADLQRIDWKTGVKKYIIRWDKVNATCSRLGDAASITTTITHFAHRGQIDTDYDNPFDSLYPWSNRKLCKVDRTLYAQIFTAGGDIMGAITMWEDEPGFALDGETGDMDMVYTPTFWCQIWEDESYIYVGVADGEVQGWKRRPATVGARYHASEDGDGNLTSRAGGIAKRGTPMSTLHSNAKAQKMTLDDIYTWCDDTVLMVVEYATLNTQTAVGDGCSSLYAQGATGSEYKPAEVAAIGATALILPNALANACVAGGVLDIGTSNGALNVCSTVVQSVEDLTAGSTYAATHKTVNISALTAAVTTDHMVSLHGCYNAPDTDIGSKSGFIGTAGKCNAYYRGRVAHGNYWRYVLGAYRQTGTGHIWVADDRTDANNADALDTSVHTDTGCTLPQGTAGAATDGYIGTLHILQNQPMAPFIKTTGGSSASPVGDYGYIPALAAGNTILLVGAPANGGAVVGRFFGAWSTGAGSGNWNFAALLFLIPPAGV